MSTSEYDATTQRTIIEKPPEPGIEGTVLNDRFELKKRLGEGGMGQVYQALDRRKVEARDSNVYVAIKLLNDDFREHPDALITLQREARKTQELSSDHIIKVYDFDRDGETIYMTMEYLAGDSLQKVLADQNGQPMEPERAWTLLEGICKALEAAHRAGVVHSDLKPGNIMVTEDGQPKLLDFGIARAAADTTDTQETTVFDAGSLSALTPAYASREMLQGLDPDPRDDIYALGCIAYEMLSGKHPFSRASALQAEQLRVKPDRITTLDGIQWQALRDSLSFERDKRLATVSQLRENLLPQKRRSKLLMFTVFALILGALGAGFWKGNELIMGNKAAEAEARAAQERARSLQLNIDRANECLEQREAPCVARQIEIAASMAPDDERLGTLRDQYSALQQSLAEEKAAQEAEAARREAERKAAEDAAADQARQEAEKQRKINQLLQEADQCLQSGELACAEQRLRSIKALDGENMAASMLSKSVSQAKERRAAELKRYNDFLDKSRECLDAKRYNCAITSAESALSVRPGDRVALGLKEKAEAAQQAAKKRIRIE